MGRLIFLDFDGVLRRVTSNPSKFDNVMFERALGQIVAERKVIHPN
jgi:hypothetical protein